MNGIYLDWFQNSKNIQENVFDKICSSVVSEKKVPKACVFHSEEPGISWGWKQMDWLSGCRTWMKWNGIIFIMPTSSAPLKPRWGLFILNFFIGQSVLINFSIEYGRSNSPNCYFCNHLPETILHLFCECEKVSPLWDELCFLINNISGESFTFSNFEKNVWCHRPLRTWQLY